MTLQLRQNLWNHLYEEHGLTLLESELREIIDLADPIWKNAFMVFCEERDKELARKDEEIHILNQKLHAAQTKTESEWRKEFSEKTGDWDTERKAWFNENTDPVNGEYLLRSQPYLRKSAPEPLGQTYEQLCKKIEEQAHEIENLRRIASIIPRVVEVSVSWGYPSKTVTIESPEGVKQKFYSEEDFDTYKRSHDLRVGLEHGKEVSNLKREIKAHVNTIEVLTQYQDSIIKSYELLTPGGHLDFVAWDFENNCTKTRFTIAKLFPEKQGGPLLSMNQEQTIERLQKELKALREAEKPILEQLTKLKAENEWMEGERDSVQHLQNELMQDLTNRTKAIIHELWPSKNILLPQSRRSGNPKIFMNASEWHYNYLLNLIK